MSREILNNKHRPFSERAEELKGYFGLLTIGAITQDEYDKKKAELLEIPIIPSNANASPASAPQNKATAESTKCPHCNTPITKHAKFCTHCGAPTE